MTPPDDLPGPRAPEDRRRCDNCDRPLEYLGRALGRDHYTCKPCRRWQARAQTNEHPVFIDLGAGT